MKSMIYIVLDRSGSMAGKESDVIGGVNVFIAEQKKLPDPASIAFVRFDVQIERFRAMQSLSEVKDLTVEEYRPRGMTALVDAVGMTLNEADRDWVTEKPDQAIMVIVTDGQENASKEFNKEKVKAMVQAREKSDKWAFIFLGDAKSIDSFGEASALGINLANTASYQPTQKGTRSMYAAASASVGTMRATGNKVATNLGGDLDEDGNLSKTAGKTGLGTSQPDPAANIKAKIDAVQAAADAAAQVSKAGKPAWTPPTGGSSTSDAWSPPS